MESGGESLPFVAEISGSVFGTSGVLNYGDNWMTALIAVNTQKNLADIRLATLNPASAISSKTMTVGNVIEVHIALGPWGV